MEAAARRPMIAQAALPQAVTEAGKRKDWTTKNAKKAMQVSVVLFSSCPSWLLLVLFVKTLSLLFGAKKTGDVRANAPAEVRFAGGAAAR